MPHDEVRPSHAMSKGPGQPRYQGARVITCSVVSWVWPCVLPKGDAPGIQVSFINLERAITKILRRKVPFEGFGDGQQEKWPSECWLMSCL